LAAIASYLVSLDPSIPWHVTGFYPTYKMTERLPTSSNDLARARRIGMEAGLSFVYQGNAAASGGQSTMCPGCSSILIERRGFSVFRNLMKDGCCPECRTAIAGIWS
ncbi:MAG: radical SAM protein, partial [Desulfopila sp.]|nr:radical SAM protein [Desulfopila sp.]